MNLPNFDFDNLPVYPIDNSYLHAALAEEKRVCTAIDDRLRDLSLQFVEMANQMKILKLASDNSDGFFARWRIHSEMAALDHKIETNRAMRYSLTCARIERTYA